MATRTLQDLAIDALSVQDACNLCGVAQSFALAMIHLGEHVHGSARNEHPIAMLWADKIASLTGVQTAEMLDMSRAYAACESLASIAEPTAPR